MKQKQELKQRAKNIRKIRLERERAVFMKLGGKLRAYLFTGILVLGYWGEADGETFCTICWVNVNWIADLPFLALSPGMQREEVVWGW